MKFIYVALFSLMCSNAVADTPPISSASAVVMDATTNELVTHKNAFVVRPIASITKLMTAMVVLDAHLPMDEKITITEQDALTASLRGHMYSTSLAVGTVITRENLLLLALMNSHNRAAAALGNSYPGGLSAMVEHMNAKAAVLGMYDTHFVEPTGLSASNTSTARDLAVMVKQASIYPDIQRFSTSVRATASYEYNEIPREVSYGTTNRLLTLPQWDVDVQKTGYTGAAGRCVVMMTNINDTPFVVVLLNSTSSYQRSADAIRIKTWLETGSVPSSLQVKALNPYKLVSIKYKRSKRRHRR